MEHINLPLPPELLERLDAVRGDVPRVRWVRRAIEAYLVLQDAGLPGETVTTSENLAVSRRDVPLRSNVRSSADARRDVRPVPKAKP